MFRLPPFYKEDPEAWFIQVDYAFAAAGVQFSIDKYYLFVAHINKDVLDLISHLVKLYATEQTYKRMLAFAYDDIKATIIKRFRALGRDEFCKLIKAASPEPTQSDGADNKAPMILKLPRFCITSPEAWFTKVEAIFALAKITSEEEKCLQFMANLDPQIVPLIRDMLPISSMADVKTRILTQFESEKRQSLSQGCSLALITSLEKRIVELEEKIHDCDSNKSWEKHMAELEEKMTACRSNVSLEEYEVQLKKQINDSINLNAVVEKHLADMEKKTNNDAATYVSCEKRIAALEAKFKDPCDSKVTLDKYVAEIKKKMDNLLAWNVSLDRYVAEVEQKINDSATPTSNVDNFRVEKRLDTLERKGKDSSASIVSLEKHLSELKKKIDHLLALNVTFDEYIRDLRQSVKRPASDASLKERIASLEEKINDLASKAFLNDAIKEVKMRMLGLVDSVAFVEKYVDELEKKMKKMRVMSP